MKHTIITIIFLCVSSALIAFAEDTPNAAGLPAGQCTWYAYIRARESGWRIRFDKPYQRHAILWWEKVTNSKQIPEPKEGTIMVLEAWKKNPYGHVAYVEKVLTKNEWVITHANLSLGRVVKKLSDEQIYQAKCKRTKDGVIIEGSDQIFLLRGFLTSSKTELKNRN